MNKLTKIGCSALCGSLSAISAANAGDLTVTGGADLTFTSLSSQVTGNPIGMGSNYTLKGDGELDNGWAFSLSIANTNANAFSATTVNLDMGGLGSLNIDQGSSSNGIDAFDDVMPTAWEEPWGAGLSTGIRLISGIGKSMNVQYTAPSAFGTTFAVALAPDMGATDTNDKGTSGDTTGGKGHGVDFRFKSNVSLGTEILSGLNIYGGGHMTEVRNNNSTTESDTFEAVGAVTYALGPVEIGWQISGEYLGEENTHAYNAYKNHAFGVAFNVNDDLSISYGTHQSRKAGYNGSNAQSGTPASRLVKVNSLQAAYTMGGASIRIADVDADNVTFSAGTQRSATIVSLGLAF
tara:strand:- start:3448 stop:4497 length:1050 start_codon:yes stop_codon:yes gene_type:complete